MTLNVFISYPSEHLEDAREIHQFIRSVGAECWFDKESLNPGDDWERVRRIAQNEADVVVVLCASQTIERNGVYQREISQALESARDKRLGSVYIVPVRLENIALPPELSRLQYVDKSEPNWKQKLARGLLRAAGDLPGDIPSMLQVAGAKPDEGGIIPRQIIDSTNERELQLNWFQYALHGEYWDFVNSTIAARGLGALYTARRHFEEWHNKDSESYWDLTISESYRKSELVSLEITFSDYFSGAAHPNHGVETINILGPDLGVVAASDIFDHSPEALSFIGEYVTLDLRRQFPKEGDSVNLDYYAKTYGWSLFDQFTFNEAGMRLNMSSSSGLPHVLGFLDVYLPWEHVSQFITPTSRRILLPE